MSLIQEALRRQQSDMDDNSGAPAPAQPTTPSPAPTEAPTIAQKTPIETGPPDDDAVPPPVQQPPQLDDDDSPPPPPPEALADTEDAPPPPPPGKDSKAGLKVAALIMGAVLCLGLGVWAITFAIQKLRKPPVPVEVEPDTPGDPAPVDPAPVEDPTPVEPIPVEPVEPVAVAPDPDPVAVEPAPDPIAVKEPVIWPVLIVSGLLGKGDQGAVMFDTEIVSVGESIEGVRIISISKRGAELEYMGEKKVVSVGSSTE